jgi:hypothetical protein
MERPPVEDDDDELVTVGGSIPNVVSVEAIAPLTLFVRFDDGVEGKVRFEESHLYGIWAKLRDPAYFSQVGIAHGAVSWPNEEPDMCPDSMHDEIVKHDGEWVLN